MIKAMEQHAYYYTTTVFIHPVSYQPVPLKKHSNKNTVPLKWVKPKYTNFQFHASVSYHSLRGRMSRSS